MVFSLPLVIVLVLLLLPFLLGPLRNGIFHVLVSLFLLGIYLVVLFSGVNFLRFELNLTQAESSSYSLALLLLIGVPILTAIICYFSEQRRFRKNHENFYDERLFFRYGYLIQSDVVPIGLNETDDAANIMVEMYQYLSRRLSERFQKEPLFENREISVSDAKNRTDSRYFIKLRFDTLRNSTFYYFVNLKPIGEQIAVNTFQYVRSRHQWYHVLLFILTAPFHYWSWVYHRVFDKYSIHSYLGGYYYGNSFDLMDLVSYVKAANFIVLNTIETFVEEKGLMTEELRQLIVNNINNTQNIKIEKSKGVRVGKLAISTK